MAGNFSGLAAQIFGSSDGAAPVPTQNFAGNNIIGTPVPQLGNPAGGQNASAIVGKQVNSKHVVIIVVLAIALGYGLYHWSFE